MPCTALITTRARTPYATLSLAQTARLLHLIHSHLPLRYRVRHLARQAAGVSRGAPEAASYTRRTMEGTFGSEHAATLDEILLEGMRFYAYHGVNPEEQVLGQRFTVDVALAVDLRQAGQSDDLADTVSYSVVFKLVRRIVEGEPYNLLEAVAEALAVGILADFPPVMRVTVTLRKPEAPLRGAMLDAVGVRLTRTRADGNRSP